MLSRFLVRTRDCSKLVRSRSNGCRDIHRIDVAIGAKPFMLDSISFFSLPHYDALGERFRFPRVEGIGNDKIVWQSHQNTFDRLWLDIVYTLATPNMLDIPARTNTRDRPQTRHGLHSWKRISWKSFSQSHHRYGHRNSPKRFWDAFFAYCWTTGDLTFRSLRRSSSNRHWGEWWLHDDR